jgi:hypothetical protein
MSRIIRSVALSIALTLAACSSSDVSSLKPPSAPLPAAPTWSVAVTGCVKASDCNTLRNGLVFRLTVAKLLQHAVPGNEAAPLTLGIAVTHLHVVSQASSNIYGVIAGRNEVTAIVTLKTAAGEMLRSFKVTVKGGDYPFEDTIEDTYRQFDADVVAGLKA